MSTQHPRSLRRVSLIAILAYGFLGAVVAATVGAAVPDTTPAPPTDVSQPAQAASPADDGAGRGAMVPAASAGNAGAPREQRLALVIGNSNYREAPLVNPANDARAMSIKLKELGFTVMEKENANLEEMRKLVRDFGNQLQFGDVGLFYYAGHGIQSANVNYLIPVDADIQDETELASRAFTATEVQEKMGAAKNRVNIVILDACRNNPLARKVRSAGSGLAAMEEGSGMIVEFATSPGSTSADGEGANGLYTSEILDALSEPGLSVEEVFKRVRMGVSQKSGGEQIPWEHSSLLGDFYFNPNAEQRSRTGPGSALIRPMTASVGGVGRAREFMPVLVPRRLLENYELNANVSLSAPILVSEFTPDARRFVMVTQDRQLKALDVANGNVVFTHAGFDAPSVSADGRYVVGVSDEHLVNVVDTAADSVAVKTYRAAADVQNAYMSPSGQRLVAISHTGTVSVIKMETDTVTGPPLKLDGDLAVQFAPGVNRAAVTTSKSGELALLDLDTGKRIGRSSAQRKPIQLVRFSYDGSLLLTAADADGAYVWRTSDGSKLAHLNIGDENALPGQAEFIDDGKRVLLNVSITEKQGGTHYRLGTWDVASGKAQATLLADAQLSNLRLSVDRQQVYVTATDHSIRVFDLNTMTLRTTLSGADLIGFSSDGARLLAREGDGIRLYDAHNLTPIARMPNQVSAFIAPKSNATFATAATDGSLGLWDFEHGYPGSLLTGHLDTVSRVAFAGSGKQLVSFSKERIAKIWALPEVQDVDKLHKDTYESTIEYQKRVAEWSSPFHTLVQLGDYNADAETYAVKVGDYAFAVPVPRDNARLFAGQREAVLSGRLKVFDGEQLQLGESKLERVP